MDLTGISTPIIAGAVIFTGLVVVFVALVGLWGIVALFGMFFTKEKKVKPPIQSSGSVPEAPVVASTPQQQPMQIERGVGDEVVAVIAAAVAAMSGGTAVLHSVKRVRQARSNWAQAGVLQNTQQF